MSDRILQLNFKYGVTSDEYTQAVMPMAKDFAALPGLRWKIWIINEAQSEAGGLYLFENQAALDAFLQSPLATAVTNHPALKDFSVKQFDVMDQPTSITRGPVKAAIAS